MRHLIPFVFVSAVLAALAPAALAVNITNTTAASGQAYQQGTIDVGQLIYIDRSYTFTSIPTAYLSLPYIPTANDDKASTGASFPTFDVDADVTVYVAHDNRISPKPGWLSAFTDTGDDISTNDASRSG